MNLARLKRSAAADANVVSALNNFLQAATQLSQAWQSTDEVTKDMLNTDYPFDKDFEELVNEIQAWLETVQQAANQPTQENHLGM